MNHRLRNLAAAAALGAALAAAPAAAAPQVHYRSALIEGVEIAYREAGDPAGPAVLLLHGFPTSSHMFRELIPALAERYHVLAPDYPGRSEEHTSELQSLMRTSYAVLCPNKKRQRNHITPINN